MMKHRDDPLFWSLQLAGWSAYAVALMVPWLGRYPLSIMWSNKVVIAGTGLLVSSVLRFAYRRVARGGLSLPAIAVLVVVLSVVAAFVWNAIASTLLGQSLQHDSALLGALGRTWPRFDGAVNFIDSEGWIYSPSKNSIDTINVYRKMLQ